MTKNKDTGGDDAGRNKRERDGGTVRGASDATGGTLPSSTPGGGSSAAVPGPRGSASGGGSGAAASGRPGGDAALGGGSPGGRDGRDGSGGARPVASELPRGESATTPSSGDPGGGGHAAPGGGPPTSGARSGESAGSVRSDVPRVVSPAEVTRKRAAKEVTASPGTATVLVIDKVFTLLHMLGAGDHWPLDATDKAEWVKDFDGVYATAKGPRTKKFLEAFGRAAPGVSLTLTTALIVGPRVWETRNAIRQAQAEHRARAEAEARGERWVQPIAPAEIIVPRGEAHRTHGPVSENGVRENRGAAGAGGENAPATPAGPGRDVLEHSVTARVPEGSRPVDPFAGIRAARARELFTRGQ